MEGADMNIFTFTGNLGGDAETRYTAGGTAVCSFSVAVKAGFGDKAHTSWVRCNLWGKRAEGGLVPYLVKGQQVCVSGELDVREWEKDGAKNKSVEVRVNEVDLIGEKKQQAAPQSSPQDHSQSQRDGIIDRTPSNGGKIDTKVASEFTEFDDDIPF
jgi:single-strand DNA-binding protein